MNQSTDLLIKENSTRKILSFLFQIKSNLIDKRELLNLLFNSYQKNSKRLKEIEEFEHFYLSKSSLDYFLNPTFISSIFQKSLQLNNIQFIYLLRFFLQDLNEQLNSCLNFSNECYKGQLMSMNQIEYLNYLNENQIEFSFNNFLILNENKEEILNNLNNSTNTNSLHKVLFEFQSNQLIKIYKTFLILPILTFCKINSIKLEKRIWIINLKITNEINQIDIVEPIQFGIYLKQIHLYDQSEQIFKLLLKQYPLENSKFYFQLGKLNEEKCLYSQSLNYYLKSIENVSKEDYPIYLNSTGLIYDYLNDYTNSLNYYFKSLKLIKSNNLKSILFNNIGITYANLKQYHQALEYFQKSLNIEKNSSRINILYNNIALIYFYTEQFDTCEEYFQLALKSCQLNKKHQGIILQNLAYLYQNLNQLDKSLKFYKDSLEILHLFQSIDHPTILFIQKQIEILLSNWSNGIFQDNNRTQKLALNFLLRFIQMNEEQFQSTTIWPYIIHVYMNIFKVKRQILV